MRLLAYQRGFMHLRDQTGNSIYFLAADVTTIYITIKYKWFTLACLKTRQKHFNEVCASELLKMMGPEKVCHVLCHLAYLSELAQFVAGWDQTYKFHLLNQRNRIMLHKSPHRPTHAKFLPEISVGSSQRLLKISEARQQKENRPKHDNFMIISGREPDQSFTIKKNIVKSSRNYLEQVIDVKLAEQSKKASQTRRKFSRAWAPRQLDLNRETAKTQRLKPLLSNSKELDASRRKSKKQDSSRDLKQELTIIKGLRDKSNHADTMRLTKAASERITPTSREKVYSCKVAMKKGVFPLTHRLYEQIKIIEHFERDDALSTIHKKEEPESEELFISIDSYANLVC